MSEEETFTGHTDYARIEAAITYIREQFQKQPSLDEVAAAVHLSPFHFQRLFKQWAGVSPKQFLAYTTAQYARQLLQEQQHSNSELALFSGLSGTGRLHDLFVKIVAMSPAEYKKGAALLHIQYSSAATMYGDVLIASTGRGICHMQFYENKTNALTELKAEFPNAIFSEVRTSIHREALQLLEGRVSAAPIVLHIKGSAFRLKVWECLLSIPAGRVCSYAGLARGLEKAGAARAVGSAIGSNPVAWLIPCHRVIQSNGQMGGYRWGISRKVCMLAREAAEQEGFMLQKEGSTGGAGSFE